MNTRQALIAIGGRATRLRQTDYPVGISKSFLPVNGQPLLYWTLISLYRAGITRLVLCGDKEIQLREAELILYQLGLSFQDVKYFSDPGLGVHGLPYQVITQEPTWLEPSFLFECGHSLMTPSHYLRLIKRKNSKTIVFSAFRPHPSNSRQPVVLKRQHVEVLSRNIPGCMALAHPILADTSYAMRLPYLSFNINRILEYYADRAELNYVISNMPPEFDVVDEVRTAMPVYEDYTASSLVSLDWQRTAANCSDAMRDACATTLAKRPVRLKTILSLRSRRLPTYGLYP